MFLKTFINGRSLDLKKAFVNLLMHDSLKKLQFIRDQWDIMIKNKNIIIWCVMEKILDELCYYYGSILCF